MVRVFLSHRCAAVSILTPGAICGLNLLFVVVLDPRAFSPDTPVFTLLEKPTPQNSNLTRNPRSTGSFVSRNNVNCYPRYNAGRRTVAT